MLQESFWCQIILANHGITFGDRPCIVMFLTVYVCNVTIHGLSPNNLRDAKRYADDLDIRDFNLNFPQFNLLPLVGIHPFMLQDNTQLQSGEVRQLSFTLPSSLEGLIDRAALTLKFYDVSDEYTGDLSKAHWVSEPFITEEVRF